MNQKDCDCGICKVCCNLPFGSEIFADDSEVTIFDALDPISYKFDDLISAIGDGNKEEIILLNELRRTSNLIKIAAKHKPNNPSLWSRCLADARKRFDVCPCVPVDFSYALSESGWKSYYDLKIGDKIISYNREKNQLEWDVIKNIHFYEKAKTIRMYKSHTCFDFISTKDHKWVIKNKERNKNLSSNYKERDYKYVDQLVSTENITKNMSRKKSSAITISGVSLFFLCSIFHFMYKISK
jgi:hypothetical protein